MSHGGFSKTRLARAREIMNGYVTRGDIPGIVALISRAGETHVEVLGKSAQGGPAMTRDSIFRISSMTKPITAVAALILIEECKLRLDDPIDLYLPELANRRVLDRLDAALSDTVPARRPITTRDLLTFRMGFGQVMAPPNAYPILRAANEQNIGMGPPRPQAMPAADEWLRRLGALPLMYQPGERWSYNTGSDVLGVLIARASGQPFETFLRERIFEPLGMKDTSFHVPAAKLARFTTSYWTNFATGATEVYDAPEGQWSRPPAFASGAAGLVSTVDDYHAFSAMLLSNGKHGRTRILSRASIEAMTTDQLTIEQKAVSGVRPGDFDAVGWGFGVSVVTRRDDVAHNIGTYGWDGGLGSSWRVDPKEQLMTILLTQRGWAAPVAPAVSRDFWTSAYQAIDD
jgi:CubicO group peptidase (beta-lactamase class C family)